MGKQLYLFGEEVSEVKHRRREDVINDYDGFVEKFKPKKTTDDCYTPVPVYSALVKYIDENVQCLNGFNIVRPFYPGKDYKAYDYKQNDIVIDNPPFSILSKILDFYIAHDIKFWLFAPHLTLFQYSARMCTLVICNTQITYENNANVNTSFVTNLYPKEQLVNVNGELHNVITEANRQRPKRNLNRYRYPENVVTSAELGTYIAAYGKSFIIKRDEAARINKLDCQQGSKTIFGSGLLISDEAVKSKLAVEAEKVVDSRQKVFELSPREKQIIANLK